MPLRVVVGASKFIEGASLYKTFTTALRASEMHPFWWLAPYGQALSGLRVDGPMGRRFLRGLSLTAAMPLRVVVGASKL